MVPEPPPADLPRLSWDQARDRRLARHGLVTPSSGSAADIVAAICGAHAQVMSAAELAIGMRSADLDHADVRRALWQDRSLVKTFGPRGTVHLLPARDLPMWCGALGGLPSTSGLPADARLAADQQQAVVAAIDAALSADALTVDQLDEAVRSACGQWAGDLVVPGFSGYWPRWRQAMAAAANAGVLCFGPARGRRVTYASPVSWLPGFRPAPAGPASGELLRAYLDAYGPATAAQFARWVGAPRRWAEQLLADCSARLAEVELDGGRAWVNAGDTAAAASPALGILLLPYFDPYIVGSHPRLRVFAGPAADRALSHGQAGTVPALLVDGTVAGVWHLRRSGRSVHVTVEPFGPLGARHRGQLQSAVDRVGKILGAQPELTVGPVTARPHA